LFSLLVWLQLEERKKRSAVHDAGESVPEAAEASCQRQEVQIEDETDCGQSPDSMTSSLEEQSQPKQCHSQPASSSASTSRTSWPLGPHSPLGAALPSWRCQTPMSPSEKRDLDMMFRHQQRQEGRQPSSVDLAKLRQARQRQKAKVSLVAETASEAVTETVAVLEDLDAQSPTSSSKKARKKTRRKRSAAVKTNASGVELATTAVEGVAHLPADLVDDEAYDAEIEAHAVKEAEIDEEEAQDAALVACCGSLKTNDEKTQAANASALSTPSTDESPSVEAFGRTLESDSDLSHHAIQTEATPAQQRFQFHRDRVSWADLADSSEEDDGALRPALKALLGWQISESSSGASSEAQPLPSSSVAEEEDGMKLQEVEVAQETHLAPEITQVACPPKERPAAQDPLPLVPSFEDAGWVTVQTRRVRPRIAKGQ